MPPDSDLEVSRTNRFHIDAFLGIYFCHISAISREINQYIYSFFRYFELRIFVLLLRLLSLFSNGVAFY